MLALKHNAGRRLASLVASSVKATTGTRTRAERSALDKYGSGAPSGQAGPYPLAAGVRVRVRVRVRVQCLLCAVTGVYFTPLHTRPRRAPASPAKITPASRRPSQISLGVPDSTHSIPCRFVSTCPRPE
eukprot:6040518-Prymnesium_polylepis.1